VRPIGDEQLRLLITLGTPSCVVVSGIDRSARGLLELYGKGECYRISAQGLRHLADQLEAGRVDRYLEKLRAK
jgi:hypothetical protein